MKQRKAWAGGQEDTKFMVLSQTTDTTYFLVHAGALFICVSILSLLLSPLLSPVHASLSTRVLTLTQIADTFAALFRLAVTLQNLHSYQGDNTNPDAGFYQRTRAQSNTKCVRG